MSQGDGLKLQRGAAANTEREQGSEGGKNCDHAHDGKMKANGIPLTATVKHLNKSYRMVNEKGDAFDAEIPVFSLDF
jgi:uncharacterized protein affecting Mg2+/Co2+ transport